MDVKEIIEKRIYCLDGAMGTMLQKKGMKMGVVPETLGITKPDWLLIFINNILKPVRILFMQIHLAQTDIS